MQLSSIPAQIGALFTNIGNAISPYIPYQLNNYPAAVVISDLFAAVIGYNVANMVERKLEGRVSDKIPVDHHPTVRKITGGLVMGAIVTGVHASVTAIAGVQQNGWLLGSLVAFSIASRFVVNGADLPKVIEKKVIVDEKVVAAGN